MIRYRVLSGPLCISVWTLLFPPSVAAASTVAAGDCHTVAPRCDGAVLARGSNGFGRLGASRFVSRAALSPVSPIAGVTSMRAGSTLDPESGVFVWQLGTGFRGSYEHLFQSATQVVPVSIHAGPRAARQ